MYSRLESYPVTTTHPTDPQHQILRYPLTKSALLSQASIQVAYPRPTVFIPSSRSSSHSSGSSPEFLTEEANQHPIVAPNPLAMSSQQPSSFSNRALSQGRPLPQVPPLPLNLLPTQPPVNNPPNSASMPNPSPITSPSSPTTLHRPKRALPIIPPSPRTPQMTGHPHLSDSPATPSFGLSDVPTPSQSSSVERLSKHHANLSADLSSVGTVLHHLPPLRQQPRTRVTPRRVNAEASSSKVQLPPQSPVSLDDLLVPLPPPRPKLKVHTPQLTKAVADHSHRESQSTDRPKLRIHTPLTEPDSAPFNRTRHQVPQRVQPLPRLPIQADPVGRVSSLGRRASLDSLTTRSSALLNPGQALSPYVSKRPRSRRYSRNPQLYGLPNVIPGSESAGALEAEPISPMKFVPDNSDEERDDEDQEFRWNQSTPARGSHSVGDNSVTQYQGVLILSNPTILNSTADEVIDKRLDRIRRRHGDTVIRAFDVDPRIPLDKDKGKSRAHGVGRFVLSEGEEGETDEDDDFYKPSPRPEHRGYGDYQNYISDHGYGYGHEQAQDVPGQPEIYGNPHFIGNAYEYRQASSNVVNFPEEDDSDPDAWGDANKTPAAMFPPKSVQGKFEIEDVMVFEKPAAIFDDLDDDLGDNQHVHKQRHVVTNARSVSSHEPVSSDSDLALSGYTSRGSNVRHTPSSSREGSRNLVKHMLRLSGSTSGDKFGGVASASSSSSSFITPPPSSFQDQGFQQTQNPGPNVLTKKPFARKWLKEKGGQKWEQVNYDEATGGLKKSV